MSVWKAWDTLLFAPFNGSVSVSSSCLCSVGLFDTVCQLSLQLKTKCWQFCTRKAESGSKRFLHWLWRSASTQWQNQDIVAWLPGSTLHAYFVYQAVTTAGLWHPFGCRFKSCRVGIQGFKTNSFSFCPVNSPSCNCLFHTQTHTMQTLCSILSQLDVELLRLDGIFWQKLYNSMSIANLPLMTLCHLLPKIYLLNNLFGDKVLFILYYLFLFKCISFSQNQHLLS